MLKKNWKLAKQLPPIEKKLIYNYIKMSKYAEIN